MCKSITVNAKLKHTMTTLSANIVYVNPLLGV